MVPVGCLAQAPVINDVQPLGAGPSQKIVITGSGFDGSVVNNSVWFDHVKGTVTAATIYSLEVLIPAQARFTNVEVVNLTTKLSGKSKLKFMPSYGGFSFDVSKTSAVFTNTDVYDMFDIASCDVDLDGKPDLVTSRGGPSNNFPVTDIFVFKNTSTGIGNISFIRNTIPLTLGGQTANVTCGDLNGDGKPEIIATRGGNNRNELFILRNTNTTPGTISFAASTKILIDPTEFTFRASTSDLNGDGKPEIIVTNSHPTTDSKIYVFVNQSILGGAISFANPVHLTVTGANSTYGLDVQDIDGDAKPDIIVNQFQNSDIFIFRNITTGTISFDPVIKVSATGSFVQITSADVDKDGLLDLIGTSIGSGSVLGDQNIQIWINKSTPGNIAFNSPLVLTTSKGPWGVDVSDIDGDGDADIVVTNKNISPFDPADVKINIFRQDSHLSFQRLDITTTNPTRNLRVGDYDGDGKPDIAFTSFPNSGLTFSMNVIRNANCWQPAITGSSTQICSGQTIRLQTKPALGVSFVWAKDGSPVQTSAQEFYDATAAGIYKVTATGTFDTGCALQSTDYMLTQNNNAFPNPPTINNAPVQPCLGAALTLSTPDAADTYSWTGPNNFASALQNPSISSVGQRNAGIYTLQLKMNSGCQSSVTQKLLDVASVPVLPVTTSPSANGCANGSITLSVSGSGYNFAWNKGGVPTGQTGPSLVLTGLSASSEGDYSVTVASLSNSCSQESERATVKVLSEPVVNFSFSTPQCKGQAITFTDQSIGDSRGTLTYLWSFDNVSTSTQRNPSFTYNAANSYSPSLLVSYGGACAVSISKPLTVSTPVSPVIVTTANPICNGDETTLSVNGPFTSYNWVGATGTTSNVVITQASAYTVNTIDANGCAGTGSLTIDMKPSLLPFAATSKRATISLGDTTQLNATSGADSYLWSPPEAIDNQAIANPIAKPAVNTAYIVVAKKFGFCDATDTVAVSVLIGEITSIKAPVLFSPNGDTINDTWQVPDALNCPDCTMTIYDGHGSQVYQQKGYNSTNAWDGNYNGKESPSGIYFYVFSNSKDKPATGSVLLVR